MELEKITLSDYESKGKITLPQKEKLIEYITNKKNILIVGGTGSGKTTLFQCLINEIYKLFPNEKIAIVDNLGELIIEKGSYYSLSLNGDISKFEETTKKISKDKPDRILLSEIQNDDMCKYATKRCTATGGVILTMFSNYAPQNKYDCMQNISSWITIPAFCNLLKNIDLIIKVERKGFGISEIIEISN